MGERKRYKLATLELGVQDVTIVTLLYGIGRKEMAVEQSINDTRIQNGISTRNLIFSAKYFRKIQSNK